MMNAVGFDPVQIIDCGPTYTLIGTDDNAVVFCGTRFSVSLLQTVDDHDQRGVFRFSAKRQLFRISIEIRNE